MASKTLIALFLTLNLLLFFNLVASAPPQATFPLNAHKFGMCADVLGSLLDPGALKPKNSIGCCVLVKGVGDLNAAGCICDAIKLNLLGSNLNVPKALSLLLHYCSKPVPTGFQ